MENSTFSLLRRPRVVFGPNTLERLPSLVSEYGRHVLLVTGAGSLHRSGRLDEFFGAMRRNGMRCERFAVQHEPSPEMIDEAVFRYRKEGIDVVLAVGGGSVLDAGKAISAMLPSGGPVERHIEGAAEYRPHDGSKSPFVAVPTTAGTGTEATDNAVISRVGRNGYKRSLRHQAFVPDVALIDPGPMLGLPPELTASSGMDAGTQLIEAYLSPRASHYTDAVAWSGLERFARSFLPACGPGGSDPAVRADMAYAALMSGIALSNAGLGIVHGFASSIGGAVRIPHGTLCATLLASATKENIRMLGKAGAAGRPFLEKYGRVGRLLAGDPGLGVDDACRTLVRTLESWAVELRIPRLGAYGVGEEDLSGLAARTRSKNNPVHLAPENLLTIMKERL